MIEIKIRDTLNEEEYNNFLQKSDANMIYHTSHFLKFLENTVSGKILIFCAYEGSQLVAAMPCITKQTSHGVVLNSLPWFGSYGAIVVTSGYLKKAIAKQELLKSYKKYIAEKQILSSTVIVSPFESDKEIYDLELQNTIHDIRNCQISILPKDGDFENYLMKDIKQKTRNLIRKSLKQNFILIKSDSESDWQYLFTTHKTSMENIGGKYKPIEHFQNLKQYIPKENRELYLAYLDGMPVAAMLVLYYGDVAEYLIPVISVEHRDKQPLSFLIWEGMQDAYKRNIRYWNFGGTWLSQKSLHHFKEGFGALDYEYKYFITIAESLANLQGDDFEELKNEAQFFYLKPY